MYVLDPLMITARKEIDEVHSLATSLMSRLDEMKKKEDSKGKKKPSGDLASKVREGLKGNKYTDEQTGKEISFGTAYSRGNAKAKQDFSNAMGKAKQDEEQDVQTQDKKDTQPLPPPKSISQLDPKKVNDHAVKLLKAIRGHDKDKAVKALAEIEEGSERGTIEALMLLLSQPEMKNVLGGDVSSNVMRPIRQAPDVKQPIEDQVPSTDQGKAPDTKQPPSIKQPSKQAPSIKQTQPKDQVPAKPSIKQTPPSKDQIQPPKDQTLALPASPKQDQTLALPASPKEDTVVIKPRLDLDRVKQWAKQNGKPNLITKGLEKQIATLDVDMDENDLQTFMESYSNTISSFGKISHADKKKYKDADLSSIKDPKELAKVMAIKKEAQAYFDPLNGLDLDSINLVQDIESEKQYIREAQQKRYSKMPPEDRLEMGNKLQEEIKKIDTSTEEGKKKLALLESAYDGVIASTLFQNDKEEMAKVFMLDPMEGMSKQEKDIYVKKQEQKKIQRDKEIQRLSNLSKPLTKDDIEKKNSNDKEIQSLSTKAKESDLKIKDIEKQIKDLKANGKGTKKLENELSNLHKEHKDTQKKITSLENENKAYSIRNTQENENLALEYDNKIKGEIDAVKEKILKAQQDPKADKQALKQDIKVYKDLMVKKEKAMEAKSALREYKKEIAKLESLNNEKIKEGIAYTEQSEKVKNISNALNALQDKKDNNETLTPKEEQEFKDLSKDFKSSVKVLEEIKKKVEIYKKQEEDKKLLQQKRYPVDQNIVALVQTIKDPKVLGALTEMTKAKDQPSYKENLRKVFDSLGDEDLMKAVSSHGDDSPVQEMAKLLSPSYCPEGSSKEDDKCNVTLSYAQKKMVREHLLDYISNEMFFTNADKGKTKEVHLEDTKEDTKEEVIKEEIKEKDEVAKHTEAFEKALTMPNLNNREETIKKILTDLNLARAGEATKDEKVKAMIEAIKRENNLKKRQEYLEILQRNDSEPKLFENIKLGKEENLNKVFINFNNNSKGQDFMKKKSTTITNYQEVASTFQIGMKVFPFYGGNKDHHGTVVAIYPAIGMVDVQFPFGSARYPVEDLQIADLEIEPVKYDSIPGGLGTKPVNAKTALYWADKDRKYRMCRSEESPTCPRCKSMELRKTIYKRMGGRSERLLCCPECLFLIKTTDILGFNS